MSSAHTGPVENVGSQTAAVPARIWPEGRPFALFLSHDVDQIHDRELFRVLADCNHILRCVLRGENGNVPHAVRRVFRSLVRPKDATADFETILRIEAGHGFRSTWFLLHDRYWARHGARYSFKCDPIHSIVRMILDAGGELGVHGGYYRFNNAALYRASLDAVADHFGVTPCGIRNHLLRFSEPETWRAQAAAGFTYDATWCRPDHLGALGERHFPFFPYDSQERRHLDILELPITVMDVTLFRYHKLTGEAALEAAWQAIQRTAQAGGVVSLLWHNNYFNEPEYWDWQMVYQELLSRLAQLKPWCATGAELTRWWRERTSVAAGSHAPDGGHPRSLCAPEPEPGGPQRPQ